MPTGHLVHASTATRHVPRPRAVSLEAEQTVRTTVPWQDAPRRARRAAAAARPTPPRPAPRPAAGGDDEVLEITSVEEVVVDECATIRQPIIAPIAPAVPVLAVTGSSAALARTVAIFAASVVRTSLLGLVNLARRAPTWLAAEWAGAATRAGARDAASR